MVGWSNGLSGVILGGLGGVKRGVNGVGLGVFGVWARDLGAGGCSGVGGVVGGRAFLLRKVFWSTVVFLGSFWAVLGV